MATVSTSPVAEARHFVLVHGSCHGAWCWYKLVSLLKAAGHKVTALDLAASGNNLVPLDSLQTVDDYHKPLYSYLETLPAEDRIILVGHSSGGLAVSSAMERFPTKIALAVFVSASMVGPDLTYEQINKYLSSFRNGDYKDCAITFYQSGYFEIVLFGHQYMLNKVYQLSQDEDLHLATLLVRKSRYFFDDKSQLELLVTKKKYGTVPRAYFIGAEDKAISAKEQQWMIDNNPPDEVRKIEGADHMVMISKPQKLCQNLLEVAKKYY